MNRESLERWLEYTELPMLGLAVVAVLGYLADLSGTWAASGLQTPYLAVALVIDVLFTVDLIAKASIQRGAYLKSPWFLIDLVSAVPILSSLQLTPGVLQGLRFVRVFRVLRALRILRGLRSLRVLRLISRDAETMEQRRFDTALTIAVVVYSAVFVGLVVWSRGSLPEGDVVAISGAEVATTVSATVRRPDGSLIELELPAWELVRNPDTAELWLVVGSIAGMFLVLVIARFQIPALFSQQMRALLNVALPQQVAEHLLKHPDLYDQTVRGPATIIFCDIKGFTATVERLPLDEVKKHLEHALDAVVDAHIGQDLIIDKYIGDAVMSFRGGNLVSGGPDEHAYRVVRGALDGAKALREAGNPHFQEVKVGGASATDALIGTFGTSKRLSYTILGDRVNLAARLEGACNGLGVRNLFCDLTHDLLAGRDDLRWRRIGALAVSGKHQITRVWEAFDHTEAPTWLSAFEAALVQYEARAFPQALAAFEAIDAALPDGDGPSRVYIGLCRERLENGTPDLWQPTLTSRK